jgi:hypothetical protein
MHLPQDYSEFLASFASSKFHSLWPAQAHILHAYATVFSSKPDIAVELPTGAGKTLIALLIAEAWRQEGKKVAILSANKTLARQMWQEAQVLNIPAILMEGRGQDIPNPAKIAYGRAANVAIMNYWVYFNQDPVIDIADLLIMDDAHLAEHCLHSLYSVEIERKAHESLFKTLITELQERFPEYSVLADALADEDVPNPSPTELLSFIDQATVAQHFREIIGTSPYLHNDQGLTDLGFRWGRLKDHLYEANIYINSRSIWIRPYIYPLLSNLRYEQTQQRIYMSATVGDPGDLSRRLGVRKIEKIPVLPEYMETTVGRRLIIMNRIEEADLPQRLQKAILTALGVHPKSVWLCSSKEEANKFQRIIPEWLNSHGLVGHPTWLLTPTGEEIEQFKQAPKGHLFVAGRFDGMDFRADECRLVILTTLPRAINTQEEFISAYLRDSGFMTRRLNQRIIQALGRCNRAEDDFGVYIFADRRFASHFGLESNKKDLPRNIIAEIDMAQNEAEIPVDSLTGKIMRFLQSDFEQYDADLHAYRTALPTAPAVVVMPDTSVDEVIGWGALFSSQNYALAAGRFETCWHTARSAHLVEIGAFHGWHQAKALYLQGVRFSDPTSQSKALVMLEAVIQSGGQSSWFNRMRASLNRARHISAQAIFAVPDMEYADVLIRTFDDLLEQWGTRGNQFERWCSAITANLESENHAQFQEGIEQLGQVLGYSAMRPRYRAATDCLWRGVFGNSREVITFEAKIEQASSGQIEIHDVGQALIQLSRATNEFQHQGFTIRGTIVTHLTTIDPSAEASAQGIKVIEKAAVLALWHRVRTLFSLYRSGWSLDDIAIRRAAALALRPKIPQTRWLIRTLDTGGRFLGESHLCAEWVSSSTNASRPGLGNTPFADQSIYSNPGL